MDTHLISQDAAAGFVLHAVCSLSQLLLTEHHHTTEVALDCAVWQLQRGQWIREVAYSTHTHNVDTSTHWHRQHACVCVLCSTYVSITTAL